MEAEEKLAPCPPVPVAVGVSVGVRTEGLGGGGGGSGLVADGGATGWLCEGVVRAFFGVLVF